MYYCIYKNKEICDFILMGDEKGLCYLKFFSNGKLQDIIDAGHTENNNFFKDIVKQLDEYFTGKRNTFDVKLNMIGTEFQRRVWNELLKIPYGETRSYKDIAINIGNKKACRAVGMANNKNPITIIVPCHRVIGSNGKLVGYAGGLDKKEKFLDIEKKYKALEGE